MFTNRASMSLQTTQLATSFLGEHLHKAHGMFLLTIERKVENEYEFRIRRTNNWSSHSEIILREITLEAQSDKRVMGKNAFPIDCLETRMLRIESLRCTNQQARYSFKYL